MQETKHFRLAALLRPAALCSALIACSSPSSPSPAWSAHDAFRQCGPALQGEAGAPLLTCDALNLCANEAALSSAELRLLQAEVSRLGCAPL